MSGKQERKPEELAVNGPAFRSVLEQARKRQAVMIGLRAMIDEAGPELKDMVLRPGEIERMKQNLLQHLRANGEPGADEQADQFEAMLVEIRRRVEQGTLRFSRKATGKGTAGTDAASSNGEATGQNGLGGSAAPEGEGGEGETPPANESGDEPQVQAFMTNAEADPTDDGDDEGGLDESSQSPESDTAEMADDDSDSRDKATGKGTAGRDAASSNGEATGQNGLGGSAAPEGEGGEGETPPANESGDGPQVQAFRTTAEADPTDDRDDEGGLDESSQSPEPETAEMADEDSDSREDEQEEGDGQASQPHARATDWRDLPGGDGSRDDS